MRATQVAASRGCCTRQSGAVVSPEASQISTPSLSFAAETVARSDGATPAGRRAAASSTSGGGTAETNGVAVAVPQWTWKMLPAAVPTTPCAAAAVGQHIAVSRPSSATSDSRDHSTSASGVIDSVYR